MAGYHESVYPILGPVLVIKVSYNCRAVGWGKFKMLFLYNIWLDVVQLASTIVYSGEQDALIWQYNSNGVYSSCFLYKIVTFRWAKLVHVPLVWGLKIPPRVNYSLGW